ncbi:MAG: hypothetical protein QXS20_10945 [Candidatus Thorarchaeota archaeon]
MTKIDFNMEEYIGPKWGTRRWQWLVLFLSAAILLFGTISALLDLSMGIPLWWYNLSFVLFALSGLGLVLLVSEGKRLLDNIISKGTGPIFKRQANRCEDETTGSHQES